MIALAVVAAASAQESVRHHVAQAKQFVKNHWYADAAAEIEAALALEGGATDFEANWLGAQIYYELVDIDRALPLAKRAGDLAPSERARDRADAFHAFLRDSFGWVEIAAPHDGVVSRLQVECTSVLFDADLKRLVNKVSLELRERTVLPARVALPAGDYLVNGAPVTVAAGETATLSLAMSQLGARGLAALQVTRVEVSAGLGVLFGDRVDNLHPGAVGELSLTQPVGPLLVGLVGAYDLRSYSAGGATELTSPYGWSAGVRVGRELVVGGPLAVRPSVGARYARVPGIALSCVGEPGDIRCGDPASVDGDLEIYAVGRAVVPFGELSVEYREAGRTTALGAGVKAVVEQAIGDVPDPGEAVLFDDPDGARFTYTTAPPTWTATGVRLLANLSIAF
ncbi:MAG: hypothetical protein ACOZNI_01965 [Myxococcota bacterium]